MHIREYQQWLEEWDRARTWDRVLPSHKLLHALEELGEVSKLVQMLEGYREPKPADLATIRAELALELSDLQVMIFKLAYLCGIDMEEAKVPKTTGAPGRQSCEKAMPTEASARICVMVPTVVTADMAPATMKGEITVAWLARA